MPLNVDVPAINVTPELDEDDDHVLLDLAEALTDVEDLYEDEHKPPQTEILRKSKLKIKLPTDDEAVTDLEDFEASSDESEMRLANHEKPVDLASLDMEAPLTEESCKRQSTGRTKRPQIQFATKQKSFYHSQDEEEEKSMDEGVETDCEAYETDNEVKEIIPDNDFDLDLYKAQDVVAENANSRTTSPVSSSLSESDNCELGATLQLAADDQGGLTDVEMLGSDSDSGKKRKKTRPRSDGEVTTRRRKRRTKKLVKSHTIPYDSENEDEEQLSFEVCKKVAQKPVALRVPDFEVDFQTDVEDLEAELSDIEGIVVDDAAMLVKLTELEASCENVSEDQLQRDEGLIDVAGPSNENTVTSPTAYNIKFSPSWPNLHHLKASNCEEPVTDCENLDSDDEGSKRIPEAFRQGQDYTDVEEFSDDDALTDGFQDIRPPPSVRNLVLIQENDSQAPTIQIVPLDSLQANDGEQANISAEVTEEEMLSEVEEGMEALELYHNPCPVVLPVMEGGVVQVQEHHVAKSRPPSPGTLTDTEDVVLERRRRPPKFKSMFKQTNKLSPKVIQPALTDTEDLGLSDQEQKLSKSKGVTTPATTDSEDIMASAEEDLQAPGDVLYLKGGGYNDPDVDMEVFFVDFTNFTVRYGHKEWDASKKPADTASPAALDQAAAQQGEAEGVSPMQQATASSSKAETEEVLDQPDKDKSKKVPDQHQLSDEMKELLKELERDSKH